MPVEMTFISAFLVGLVSGGAHCPAMCGGIISALSMSIEPGVAARTQAKWPLVLAYNVGRLGSYVVAGMLAGGIGSVITTQLWSVHTARLVLQLLAAIFMLILAMYIAGWWRGLARVESLGSHVWKHVEPLGRRFLPVRSIHQALILGMLWGWLPCGLVYTALIWSISSGSTFAGGWLMLGFGLGTLPLMMFMGVSAAHISAWLNKPWLRTGSAILILLFALYMFWQAVSALVQGS